jgi:hypothetical protein
LALATVLAFATAPAGAVIKTFNQSQSTNWHRLENWTPTGVPTIDDDVLIPTGKTCIIYASNAEAATVEIEAGGTLFITAAQILKIRTPNDPSDPPTMTVNGTFALSDDEEGNPSIVHADTRHSSLIVTLTGTGVITGAHNEGYGEAEIWSNGLCMVIDEGLTVKGSLTFHAVIRNNGTVLVDGDDDLVIGSDDGEVRAGICNGSGVFKVTHSLGSMHFGNLSPQEFPFGMNLEVSAGEMSVSDALQWELEMEDGSITVSGGTLLFDRPVTCDDYAICVDGTGVFEVGETYTGTDTAFTVSGGLLLVLADFSNTGTLAYSDGTIQVSTGNTAAFSKP